MFINKIDYISLEKSIRENMIKWKVPGMTLGIIHKNEVLYSNNFGLRDIKNRLEITSDTMFPIGSASKAFTSMAIGILVDEGLIDWDTPIKTYIPDFGMFDSFASSNLTIRDMLCHRSGLPRHEFMWYNSSMSRKDIVNRIRYLEPNVDFRSVWQYNNQMYALAGYLVEVITGTPWETFVNDRILKPLNMTNTNFSIEKVKSSDNYSKPYDVRNGEITEINFRNIEVIGPAGSINSNLNDMFKWLKFHLSNGNLNHQQIISLDSMKQMHSTQIACKLFPWCFDEVTDLSYGLGWFIEKYRDHKVISHGGNIDGFSSFISFMPEEEFGIIILTNQHNNFLNTAISYEFYDLLLGFHNTNWSEKLKSEVDKVIQSMEEAKNATNTNESNKGDNIVLKDSYKGIYKNPGYGEIEISEKENKLIMYYNNFEFYLKQKSKDIFSFEYELLGIAFTITFSEDDSQNISHISIPFEPTVKDIVFEKINKVS